MNLFYYDPKMKTWKQVWLTQNAVATGPKRRDRSQKKGQVEQMKRR